MTIRTAADNKSTILQVAGVDKLKINDTGVVEADYFKTPAGMLSPVGMFKNKIINGDGRIAQRGTGQSTQGYGSVDRWYLQLASATGTLGRSSGWEDLGETTTAIAINALTGSASTTAVNAQQLIEGVNTLAGQRATVSFKVRRGSTSAATHIAVECRQYFGSGGTPSSPVSFYARKFPITTTEWTYVSFSVDVPSITDKTTGTSGNDALAILLWVSAGTDYDARTDSLGIQTGVVYVTEFQVEPGEIATPYERRPINIEQSLCERYYEKSTNLDVPPSGTISSTQGAYRAVATGASLQGTVFFKQDKRVPPTVAVFDVVNGEAGKIWNSSGGVAVAAPSIQAACGNYLYQKNDAVNSSVYQWYWTADAEL